MTDAGERMFGDGISPERDPWATIGIGADFDSGRVSLYFDDGEYENRVELSENEVYTLVGCLSRALVAVEAVR